MTSSMTEKFQLSHLILKPTGEEGSFDSEGFTSKNTMTKPIKIVGWLISPIQIFKGPESSRENEQRKLEKKEQPARTGGKKEKQLWQELAEEMDGYDNELSVLGIMTNLKPQKPQLIIFHVHRLTRIDLRSFKRSNKHKAHRKRINHRRIKGSSKRLTELADALMDLGNLSVYEETRRGNIT